jgi:hypothetical protein
MSSIGTLATFFGWCAIINFGIILLGVLFFSVFHGFAGRISSKMFGITEEEAKATFFHVFQQYRLALIVLNVVPFIALSIMT